MKFNVKQVFVNSFLTIGHSIGAGLTTIGLAGSGVLPIGIVFGLLLFFLEKTPSEAFCASFEESTRAVERLLATFTPEQLEQFNQQMERQAPRNPSFVDSLLIAVAINVAIIAFVHYAPLIWDTVVHMAQAAGRGLGMTARELAQANFERARNDPELMQQVAQIINEIAQQGGGAAGGAA